MKIRSGPGIMLAVLAVSLACFGAVYLTSLTVRDEAGEMDATQSVVAPEK